MTDPCWLPSAIMQTTGAAKRKEMKKTILLVVIFLLIIPSIVSAKQGVIVKATPHFYSDLLIIRTDGDSVQYSFTITNIGNETIKDQKLWFVLLILDSGIYYNQTLDMPELKPGDKKTLRDPKACILSEVGLYILNLGINSQGDKNSLNNITINGMIDTRNLVFDDFHTYDRNLIVIEIIAGFFGLIIALFGSVKLKQKKRR